MSAPAAAADATDATAAPRRGGKKKLLLMLAVVLVLALAGGGGAWWWMQKKKAAELAAAEAEGQESAEAAPAKEKRAAPPVFVPLDTFTVNLADRDAERYAQVGITLEVEDAKVGEQVKQFMPAVRNNILLVLSDKTAADLHAREGKQRLAAEVARETHRALGTDPKAEAVRSVHFSNFIIQ